MKLIVGLGNPGKEYVGTRHNVGFDAIDRFAERMGWVSAGGFDRVAKTKFDALSYNGVLNTAGGDEKILLLKPTTYMNLSGRPVQAACAFYGLTPADVLIVLDDLALPCGKLRLRAGGSSGGHNGLRDIEKMLATQAYPRLRIGIDAPPPRIAGRDYVLGRWSDEQKKFLPSALDRAAGAIATWADAGIEKAMSLFNVSE
ncbi:MAG TPA: aminoacyl-tRNA hydrolase [Tepidisphaeraceae bacterium]|jgi:PTH1 family peptidyl-tRNA hydrolase